MKKHPSPSINPTAQLFRSMHLSVAGLVYLRSALRAGTIQGMPAEPTSRPSLPWYYFTRVLGAAILCFGVFLDNTPERGTLILTGAGLLGIDKVARSDKAEKVG
jgi:hypothetical protein